MDQSLENKIRQIFQEMFDANYYSGNPRVPPHTHNGIDNLPIANSGGGGGTPGGSDTQVQFNDAGSFGGDQNFVYDKTTAKIGVANIVDISSGGVNIIPDGGLLLESVSDNVSIQSPGNSNGDIFILANNNIQIETTVSDITVQATDSIDIKAQGGTLTLQSLGSGGVQIEAQGSGTDVFISADDAIIHQVTGSNVEIITHTGIIIFNTSTPSTFTSGGVLYSSGGALHWLGGSGTDTILGPA